MNLFTRMLLAPAVTVGLMILLGGVSYWSISTQQTALEDLYHKRFTNSIAAEEISAHIQAAHARVYRTLAWSSTRSEGYIEKETKELITQLDAQIASFTRWSEQAILDENEMTLVRQMTEQITKYRKSIIAALDMATVDINAGVMSMQSADDNFKPLSTSAEKLVDLEKQLGKGDIDRSTASSRRMVFIALALLIVSIGVAGVVSLLMARKLIGQIGGEPAYAEDIARRIASGDLSTSVQTRSGDQSSLLAAMSQMQDALRRIVGEIQQTVLEVATNTHQMSTVSQQVSASSERQSSDAASMAAAVEESTASVANVAASADGVRNIATEAQTLSEEGGHTVENAISEINRIANSFTESSSLIQTLSTQVEKVSTVANVIKEIADQTNLLALNAAIEAARAGEQGRGFAVVADEVRKLAERTTQSTQEIATMIATIQSSASVAVEGMTRGGTQVKHGVDMAAKAGVAMQRIELSTSKVLEAVAEISCALNEQKSASVLISQNVEEIARMADENGNSVMGISRSAGHLDQLTGRLKSAVSMFRM